MGFFKKNPVVLVVIPLIIGSHMGWSALQNDTRFVTEAEKKGQPIFIVSNIYVIIHLYRNGVRFLLLVSY